MHFFDVIVVVISAVFVAVGVKRGFIGEVFRLAAVVLGFAAALLLYRPVCAKLGFVSMPPAARTAFSFLLVYVCAAVAVLVVGWLVRKLVHLTLLGWLDRLLGATLGFVKTLLLMWIVVLCVSVAPVSAIQQSLAPSLTYRVLTAIPFRLKAPSLKPSLRNLVDMNRTLGKIRVAKDRLEGFKEKVDSAKADADSARKETPEGDD